MFESQRNALAISGTPWLGMEGARNLSDGEAFEFLEQDLTGELLSVFLSLGPGRETLATLPVSIAVSSTTWAEALKCGYERLLPCGQELTDAVTVSTINVSWAVANFTNVPEAVIPNDVVPMYLELRRTNGTGPRIAGGVFYLTETNLNGDPE